MIIGLVPGVVVVRTVVVEGSVADITWKYDYPS